MSCAKPCVRPFILLVVYYYHFSAFNQRDIFVVNNLAQAGGAKASRLQDAITPGYLVTLLHV